ncbi:MAG: hypothetical protein EPO20_17480 [Betaproteobacteria bacterium]|nr:MAG: hypothetical protein EPO20_17480 [Betaproteobacteria bacterium]
MTQSIKSILGDAIAATDARLGRVDDVLFDDCDWHVRYLVVDAYAPLTGRKVLVSTDAVDVGRTTDSAVGVRLTRAEVARGPGADSAMPVERLYEQATLNYYAGAGDPAEGEQAAQRSHLRSSSEVIGYAVHGPEGLIGHIADFVLEGWRISGLALDSGKRVPSGSVKKIDWRTREVRFGDDAQSEREAQEQLRQRRESSPRA